MDDYSAFSDADSACFKLATDWIALYNGKAIESCSESDKQRALKAYSLVVDSMSVEFSQSESEGNESTYELAKRGMAWIESYTGKQIRSCDETDKLRAIRAYKTIADAVRDPEERGLQQLATVGVRWIGSYTDKDLKYCSEEEKRLAIAAFQSLSTTIGTDANQVWLDAAQQQDSFERALRALSWIEAYTGKSIKYCSEEEKNTALGVYHLYSSTVALGNDGEPLDIVQQQDAYDQALRALSWIEAYTGKSIKYCSEEDKVAAIEAYRATLTLISNGINEEEVAALRDNLELYQSAYEVLQEEYAIASATKAPESSAETSEDDVAGILYELDIAAQEKAYIEQECSWRTHDLSKMEEEYGSRESLLSELGSLEVENLRLNETINDLESEIAYLTLSGDRDSYEDEHDDESSEDNDGAGVHINDYQSGATIETARTSTFWF